MKSHKKTEHEQKQLTEHEQKQFTADFMAGLREINAIKSTPDRPASLISVVSALLKHISPYVKSVKMTGTRKAKRELGS